MIRDYFLITFRNFTRRKMRSWLTILGILIGVAAVVALISVSQGMQNAITEQFEKMGTNKFIIMAGSSGEGAMMGFMSSAYSSKQITKNDLDVVKKISGVEVATELFFKSAKIKFGKQTKYTFVIGMPTDETSRVFKDMQGFDAESGRELKKGDKYAANLGYLFSKDKEFFDKSIGVGNKIEIENYEFRVVGIIKKIGNRQDDIQIYIPIDTAREIFNEKEKVDYIYAQTKEGLDLKEIVEDIKEELRKLRDEKRGEETFQIQTFEQMLSQVNTILSIVGMVLITISAISLVVGGIGIMNTMYTSVLERTREIGIMKAIGAKNTDIALMFLIESGMLGIVGGIIGIILGVSFGKAVEYAASKAGYGIIKISFSPYLIFGALLFSFVVGAVSGTLPAIRASKLKPVEALRYE